MRAEVNKGYCIPWIWSCRRLLAIDMSAWNPTQLQLWSIFLTAKPVPFILCNRCFVYMYVLLVSLVPRRPEEVIGSPGAGMIGSCERPCEC